MVPKLFKRQNAVCGHNWQSIPPPPKYKHLRTAGQYPPPPPKYKHLRTAGQYPPTPNINICVLQGNLPPPPKYNVTVVPV